MAAGDSYSIPLDEPAAADIYLQSEEVSGTLKCEYVMPLPSARLGASGFHLVAAGSGDATVVKNAPGVLYSVSVFSIDATPVYLKFHNSASAPTPGAGVVYVVPCQAGVTTIAVFPRGLMFTTGIAFSLVTGIADANATGVTAAEVIVDGTYA